MFEPGQVWTNNDEDCALYLVKELDAHTRMPQWLCIALWHTFYADGDIGVWSLGEGTCFVRRLA